jgi:DNA helicase-2/ATP-dependent DNA helicase PcrA
MIINSDTKLPIEKDFKIEAGPGAGKTRMLVNHINNVLQNSERLGRARKIACITYTNTAVETILERLGSGATNKIEVSTIHSFLYNNIVKPYCSFLPSEYNMCASKVKGHDDLIVNHKLINEWLENKVFIDLKSPNTKNQLIRLPMQNKALINWLSTIRCMLTNGEIGFICDNSKAYASDIKTGKSIGISKFNLGILQNNLLEYKKLYWRDGRIDHEDVLFLSFVLLRSYPFILSVLRAKFPYLYIDEFQDTNPVQTFVLQEIRKVESKIGVIGDRAQSIYGFQGANVSQFTNFQIQEVNSYTIKENHRSSNQIVEFLNCIRKDINQEPCENFDDIEVTILVGERNSAYITAKNMCNGKSLISLSRDNLTSNAMKCAIEGNIFDKQFLKKYDEHDNNTGRRNFVSAYIEAIELAKNSKYKDAIKKIVWLYGKEKEPTKIAIGNLAVMLKKYDSYSNYTLMDFYNTLQTSINSNLSGFKKGTVKDFYEQTSYRKMALCVNIVEDTSNHITIHKAKGAEYENVFLVDSGNMLQFLLNPDIDGNEEHRIIYVAISRARNKLFIHLDQLNQTNENKLNNMYKVIIKKI